MSEVIVVECAHCSGTGKCGCRACEMESFGSYNTGNIAPCSKCNGSGKQVIYEKK